MMQILETREQLRSVSHNRSDLAFRCSDCQEVKPLGSSNGVGTGYGYDKEDKPVCYQCCGKRDVESMINTGKAVLYLSKGKVTNWPGTISYHIQYTKTGRHNMAGKRYDVWFTGPDGFNWHGVQYGDNTQVCHCKRIKQ